MSIILGDCVTVMAGMEPESIDAIVCDPPYGLEFMGKEWDRLDWRDGGGFSKPGIGDRPTAWTSYGGETANPTCATCGGRARGARKCACETPDWRVKGQPMSSRAGDRNQAVQDWHTRWAEAAYRVAKPSAYLLAFGGTRTVHRMTVALEDAGWIIRDMLVWGYASGFPKSKASLKPAWEPIVMARKPGPLRMLAIDECRIEPDASSLRVRHNASGTGDIEQWRTGKRASDTGGDPAGRWPANIVLTDAIFDGGVEGVVGGGQSAVKGEYRDTESTVQDAASPFFGTHEYRNDNTYANDSGTYSRFFLIPKADRADREPVLGGLPEQAMHLSGGRVVNTSKGDGTGIRENRARANVHPTVKPTDLMRHLVRLVTPTGGTVLDPFLGSGTTALAAEMEGFAWIGIEREAEYVRIAEARLNGTQRGLGLESA